MTMISRSDSSSSTLHLGQDGKYYIRSSVTGSKDINTTFIISDVKFYLNATNVIDDLFVVTSIYQIEYIQHIFKNKKDYTSTDINYLVLEIKRMSEENYKWSSNLNYNFPIPIARWNYDEKCKFEKTTSYILKALYSIYDCELGSNLSLTWNDFHNMWDITIKPNENIRNGEYRLLIAERTLEASYKLFPDINISTYNTSLHDMQIRFFLKV